jgi:hypothetical protein
MSQTGAREPRITTETKITVLFVLIGTALWYGSTTVSNNDLVQYALLVGIGVIVPTIINESRASGQ